MIGIQRYPVPVPSGGDVDGPASSTNNALALFDGTTGKLLKNSSVTVDSNGKLQLLSSGSSSAGINISPGSTPSSPANGDMWITTLGVYARVNGVTQGPFEASAGTYQPASGDLTAIDALAGTSGFLKKTATDTWALDTSTYLTANQSITLSGDATGSGTTSITVAVVDDSHSHTGSTISALDAGDTTTGTFNIARIPTGTTGTTVSLGNHTHSYLPLTGGTLSGEITFNDDGEGITFNGGGRIYKRVGAGITIKRHSGESDPYVENYAGNAWYRIWHEGNDGASSGLDADTVDGSHASAFATSGHTHSYQPVDGDLTAIAALAGTSGLLKKTAADTWTLDTTAYTTNTGTVTSVAMSVPTGLSISGTPITTSGTLALTLTAGYSIPTTTSQTNWDTAYTDRNKWDGGSSGLTAATGRTSLGGTTVGQNLFTLANPTAITFLRVNADNSVSTLDAATFRTAIGASSTVGTVTSVAMSVPTGLSISGSPITSSGTLAVTLTSGYSIPTTTSQTNWDTAYTDRNKWDGGSSGLTAATGRTSLGGTTVGQNLFTLTNPGAITFLRVNADNSVSTLNAASFRTAIGAGTSSTTGTVTSVAMTVPTGLSISGTPITTSGTLALTLTSGYEIPTTSALAAKAPLASPTFTGKVTTAATAAGSAGFNLPHGTAPSSPANGDIWSTTAGVYARINGTTVGPFAAVTGGATWGSITGTLSSQTDLNNALGGKQALDADLTAIAALAGTSGFLKKTATDTWALDTNTYLTGNQSITLSGVVTGSGATSISTAFAASPVFTGNVVTGAPGTYNSFVAGSPATTAILDGSFLANIDNHAILYLLAHGSSGTAARVRGWVAGGTAASKTVPTASSLLLSVDARGWGGTGYRGGAGINFSLGTGTFSDTSMPGKIEFLTAPDGSANSNVRLTIDQNGLATFANDVLVSGTSKLYLGTASGGFKGEIRSQSNYPIVLMPYNNSGTAVTDAEFYYSTGGNTWNSEVGLNVGGALTVSNSSGSNSITLSSTNGDALVNVQAGGASGSYGYLRLRSLWGQAGQNEIHNGVASDGSWFVSQKTVGGSAVTRDNIIHISSTGKITFNPPSGTTVTIGAAGSTGGLEFGASGPKAMAGTGGPSGIAAPIGSTWRQTNANSSHGNLTGLLWNKVGTGTAEGTDWLVDFEGRWVSYTPTVTSQSGSYASASGVGRYTRQGKTAHVNAALTVTNIGSGTGGILFTLPLTTNSDIFPLYGRTDQITGRILMGKNSSTTQATIWWLSTDPGLANGEVARVFISYEIA